MISFFKTVKKILIGKALNPRDKNLFHQVSLVAFFAWVGLGADGLSSSCYGPEEAYLALHNHVYLAFFVALGTVITIFAISSSYSQIIELFPSGGGGYVVASKLLSPSLGMVSGCALLIDYVLTIAISVAHASDSLFSFLPVEYHVYRLEFAFLGVAFLIFLNLRGVKESVTPLVPIFLLFLLTHVFVIFYAILTHLPNFPTLIVDTSKDVHASISDIGLWGTIFLVLRAFSMGAGTFTGIEAVSNGLPLLREPKVETGKRTMKYMAISLAFTVMGLMLAYLLYQVAHQPGKTLNAVLFESMTSTWPSPWGSSFVWITLFSEAAILFVAAQAGFLDGPRILANMAADNWMPKRFTTLSDRFVTQNGVLIMGGVAALAILFTAGSVKLLVVLYSINVFITFCLTQLGMVRHWWQVRDKEKTWIKKIIVNGFGLTVCSFILVTVVVLKFHEGGWVTIALTAGLISFAYWIRSHYNKTKYMLRRLDDLVSTVHIAEEGFSQEGLIELKADPDGKTAVVLVNGFNGIGLHTLFSIIRLFGSSFKNYIFVCVGVIDSDNFKGADEVEKLQEKVQKDIQRYVSYMRQNGYYAEGISSIANDAVDEIAKLSPQILERFPKSVFFGGQLVFPDNSFFTRMLHNYTVFAMQRRFYQQGVPMVVLPVRV